MTAATPATRATAASTRETIFSADALPADPRCDQQPHRLEAKVTAEMISSGSGAGGPDGLRHATRTYEGAVLRRSLWQMANSFLPFLAICALMYWSLSRSYALTAA